MKYIPSPTGKAFIQSQAFIKLILGPVGGGKSTVCLMDLLSRANHQAPFNGLRRTKFAILRNTAAQLKSTVKPMIDEWLVAIPMETQGRSIGQWRLTDNTFEITGTLDDGTRMHTELCLMAADTPDDVRRLLSLQLSAAWVEEAREIDEEVFKGLLGRVDRFPSTVAGGVSYPGVICSTNAPALETFWHGIITAPPSNMDVFTQPEAILADLTVNPEAENLLYLSEDYYPNLMAANTEEWVDVYLRNKFGQGNAGQAVYRSTFKRSFHVSDGPLVAVPGGSPLVVGMDNGLQAAAAVMQQDARGRVNVLSNCYVPDGTTMGVETFLDRLLIPHLTNTYPVRRDSYLFVLDPACFQRSQVNEATIAQAVQSRGFKVVRASTNDPEKRQAAMEGLLNRQVDGKAGILFDPGCKHLVDGMEWGYRYKRTNNGQSSTQRDKTHHSHCFVAGTRVATPSGGRPIEKLRVGDWVDTPLGPRQVTATMNRPVSHLVTVRTTAGHHLTCTPDHPFITTEGIVQADALEYTNMLVTLECHPCHEAESQSTPSSSLRASGTTSSRLATERATMGCTCTGPCGRTTMGRFPPAGTFTTSTATRATTRVATWSRFRSLSTLVTTWLSGRLGGGRPPWRRLVPRRKPGTETPLSALCALRGAKSPGSAESLFASCAPGAAPGTPGSGQGAGLSFVHPSAGPSTAETPGSTTRLASAELAAWISESAATRNSSTAVRPAAVLQLQLPEPTLVYDLTVNDAHAFFAEGVLVHNCCEAAEYSALHFNAQFSQTFTAFQSKAREIKPRPYAYI